MVRLEVLRTEPAFGDESFGDVETYGRIVARADGELNPSSPANGDRRERRQLRRCPGWGWFCNFQGSFVPFAADRAAADRVVSEAQGVRSGP